jgi:peroxiredoxin 2/4
MYSFIGRKAPLHVTTKALLADGTIVDNFNLQEAIKGKKAVFFFYPLDFTFVCPTELLALNAQYAEFQERNTEVFAISVDSVFSHLAWQNTAINEGGIGKVGYTMLSDINHSLCRTFGVEHPEENIALRATFILDEEGTIWSQTVHNLPIGRSIDEIIRVVDAISHHQQHGEVCPANWNKGKQSFHATKSGVSEYLQNTTADTIS